MALTSGELGVTNQGSSGLIQNIGQYGWIILLLGLATLYFFLMRPEIAGLWYDDGVYLLGAKALATGQGYRLLSEPGMPAIVKYPPLLSLILTPLWWMNPQFPVNLPLFKGLNILFGVGALGLLHQLARRYYGLNQWTALLLILLFGLHPVWLVLVPEVMSEPLYLLLTMALLLIATRIGQRNTLPTQREFVVCILLSVATFYTRTIGMAAILGLTLWLWRQFGRKIARNYFLWCAPLCGLWWVWTALQPPAITTQGHFYIASYNQTYLNELLLEILKTQGLFNLLWSNLTLFPANLLETVLPGIKGVEQATALLPFLALSFVGGLAWLAVRCLRKSWSPALAYVMFYLLACLLWYAHDQYPRLILPVLPLIWIALWKACQAMLARILNQARPRWCCWAARGVFAAILIVGLQVWNLLGHILELPRGNAMSNNVGPELWEDYRATFTAIQQFSQPQDIFWARYCSLYPLYTQRFVISRNIVPRATAYTSGDLQRGVSAIGQLLLPVFNQENVTYLILEPRMTGRRMVDSVDPATLNIILSAPDHFSPVYTAPHGYIVVYRYHP